MDTAIEAYNTLTNRVFSNPKLIHKSTKFKATLFEAVFTEIVEAAGFPPDALMEDKDGGEGKGKTQVLRFGTPIY